ncbi:unnamed protein product [Chironomus riparius]|uniref:Peptidase S1 domain-containing protein n=1 Tax=Chironomus riparius TaxID=315576 RepID=A0A9N9RPF4_9DIPT|nr:unnamed protein product [Chironomus riparius]
MNPQISEENKPKNTSKDVILELNNINDANNNDRKDSQKTFLTGNWLNIGFAMLKVFCGVLFGAAICTCAYIIYGPSLLHPSIISADNLNSNEIHNTPDFLVKFSFSDGKNVGYGLTGVVLNGSMITTNQHGFDQEPGVYLHEGRLGGTFENNFEDAVKIDASHLNYTFDPNFNTTGDIMFIDLKIPMNGTQSFVLPSRNAELSKEMIMTIWKELDSHNMETDEVIVKTISNAKCKDIYEPLNITIDFEKCFCADTGVIEKGNSGMPLFTIDDKGNKILWGLLSRGSVGRNDLPSIIVDIRVYSDVIRILQEQHKQLRASVE